MVLVYKDMQISTIEDIQKLKVKDLREIYLEEMIACTSTVYIIGAIIALKSCTILSSSFSRGGGCFPDA